ncbi:MAG: hypothetical protein VW397_03515 [Candidatus Margulisiibacteriota bacterium]
MHKLGALILILIFGLNSPLFSQVEMNYEMLNYMAAREADPKPNDREGIKQQFQTHFIKEIFLNNVFKSNQLFYGEGTNNDYDLVNQLMINQFAEQLVESEFIDLSHVTIE